MGPRAGLDGRKISSSPGFDPGLSSSLSIAIPTELPSLQEAWLPLAYIYIYIYIGRQHNYYRSKHLTTAETSKSNMVDTVFLKENN